MSSLLLLLLILIVFVLLARVRGDVRAIRERLDRLERERVREGAHLAAVPPPAETEAASPIPEPIPISRAAQPAAGPPPVPPVAAAPLPSAPPAAPAPPTPESTPKRFDSSTLEQLIGSVWLQNVGAVLLLLGTFFFILWGYTTGRFGPVVLVVAGAALGLAFVWRGDRMARSLPAFGHALIGIGIGVVYLALYLGHFALRVMPPWLAFALLALTSFASIAVGLRYRVQTIAALGVFGAYLPQLVAVWIPLRGFSLGAPSLLGYLAVVNLVVFGLAAQAGWSTLNLAALLLSAVTWIAAFATAPWGWPVQIGLAALFAALGFAPLPRLVRGAGPVRPLDLAVVALAPLCLAATSWPFFAYANRVPVAMLLLALAAAYLLAALWVDARRPERDLWLPLTGAATLFLTVALERALGTDNTPMAWCIEGVLLATLGLGPRGGWLRLCGYGVTALGTLWMLGTVLGHAGWSNDKLPGFYPAGLRDLVCVSAVLVGSWLLGRGRAHLSMNERYMPEAWSAVGNLLLLLWSGREARHLASALEGTGGRWSRVPDINAPGGGKRLESLAAAITSAAWLAQALVLLALGRPTWRLFLRVCGYAAAILAWACLLTGLGAPDGWSNDQLPVLYPAGLLNLAGVAMLVAVSLRFARDRLQFRSAERWMSEIWAAGASVLLLAWAAREADHVARALAGVPGPWGRQLAAAAPEAVRRVRTLAAGLTSVAWLAQALLLLVLGWARSSAFLRWSGLALFAVTVVKFLAVDLQTVDVFWRFLTAILVGAALLAVSYAYQRRVRGGGRSAGAQEGS